MFILFPFLTLLSLTLSVVDRSVSLFQKVTKLVKKRR